MIQDTICRFFDVYHTKTKSVKHSVFCVFFWALFWTKDEAKLIATLVLSEMPWTSSCSLRCKCSAHFLQWSKWVSEKKNLNASHLFGKLHFSLAPCLLKMLQEIIHSDVFLGVWWAFLVDPSYHGMVKSLFNESLYPVISGAYFISNSCRIPISMNRSGLVWEPVRVQGLKVQIAPLGKCFWKPKKKVS